MNEPITDMIDLFDAVRTAEPKPNRCGVCQREHVSAFVNGDWVTREVRSSSLRGVCPCCQDLPREGVEL